MQAGGGKFVDHVVPDVAAGSAADNVGHNRACVVSRSQRGAMCIAYVRFLAAQERGPQLHRARAEYESGSRRAAISHAAGGDDWNGHGIDHLRQQREQPRLHTDIDAGECRTMTAGLDPLRDDGSTATCCCPTSLTTPCGSGT